MTRANWLDDAMREPAVRLAYETERLRLEAAEMIIEVYESLGISRREAAKRAGLKPEAVSRSLSGEQNLTLKTLASLAYAAGCRVITGLERVDEIEWRVEEIDLGCVPYRTKGRAPSVRNLGRDGDVSDRSAAPITGLAA